MNRIELKSFLRNFIPFLLTLEILTGIIFYREYANEVRNLDQTIDYHMDVCNFNADDDQYACLDYPMEFYDKETKEDYTLEFLEKQEEQSNTLYTNKDVMYKYYAIPTVENRHFKMTYSLALYEKKLQFFKHQRVREFLFASIGILIFTTLFSLYSLAPLRHAFKLTQEFIKDILHDFNTPISALILNVKTLPKSKESYEKINRIEQSLNTILSLQENLKSYLDQHPKKKERFELLKLVEERLHSLQNLHPNLTFTVYGEGVWIESNYSSLSRILDNLLGNAAKYNRPYGRVDVHIKTHHIIIADSGKGIKHANKIFDRFYKEHERGLGIGLHIVKKLCDELGIKIKVYSKINKGTTFILSF